MFEPMAEPADPLTGADLIAVLRDRWRASYDMQLVQRRGRLYLQVMWAYLEQQSFPLDEASYGERIDDLAALLNRLGVAGDVREWLSTTGDRPRLGKAMTLPLTVNPTLASEFLLDGP